MTAGTLMRFAALLLLFTPLLDCTSENRSKVVLFVGGAPNELEAWESLVKDFERDSGISVELLRQPSDTDQQRQNLIISLDAKLKNPDVFLMDVAWVGLFAHSGWLEPLRDIDSSPYFEKVIQQVDTYKGNLIALPVYMDGGLLYFRRDLIEKFLNGLPPKTWPELLDASLKVQRVAGPGHPGFYGFVWQGAQYEGLICNFLEFAGTRGGFLLKEDRVLLDTPENRWAIQFMHDLIWKYKVSPPNTYTEMREEQTRLYFQEGDALFERNWPYAWKLHQAQGSAVEDKTGMASLPAPPSGQSVSTLGGWHIGVSRFSDDKAKALAFVKYVASYGSQKNMVLKLGWNPGRQDLYRDREVLAKMPFLKDLRDIFVHARARPVVPYYTQVSDIAQRWINAALADKCSPDDALQQAENEIAALSPLCHHRGEYSTMSASWSPWRRDFNGETREAFLFMLPLLGFIAALVLIPVLGTLIDSLFRDVTFLPRRFIGWANYLALVKDPAFLKSLRFTLFFVGVSVPLEVALGLLIALVLNEPFPLRGVVRAALLIPWAIPMAISGRIFQLTFNYSYGAANFLLTLFHLGAEPVNWLGSEAGAFAALVITDTWKTTPFAAIIFLAGLSSIPEELYEQARVDRATLVQRFFRITLPLLKPVLIVTFLFRTIQALQIFDYIYVLTGGGPGGSTTSLSLFAYTYFASGDFGYGSASSVLLFFMAFGLSVIYLGLGTLRRQTL